MTRPRLDLVLKYLCLARSRSFVKTLCDNDLILHNGTVARPSARVDVGDRVTLHLRARTISVEVSQIPPKQLSRAAAPDYYQTVETPPEEARANDIDTPEDW